MNDLQGKVDPHSLQAGSALVEEEEEVTVKEEGILGIIDEDSRIEQFSHLDLPLSQEDFVRRRERSLQARQNTMHIDVNDMDFDRESSRLRRIFSGIPSHNAAGPTESAFESRNISNVLDNARVEHPWMLLGGDPQNYQKIISESSQYFGNAASVKSKSGGEPIQAMMAADAPPRGSGKRSFSEEQVRDPEANMIPNEPPPSLSNFGAQYFPQLGQPNLSVQQQAFFQQQLLQQISQRQHQLDQQLNQGDQIRDQAEQAVVQEQDRQQQPRRELPELNLKPGEISEEADQDKEFDQQQLGVALPSPDQQREERRLRVKDSLEKKKGKRRKSIVRSKKVKSGFKNEAAVDIEDENEGRLNSQRSAQEREGLLPGGVPPAGEEDKQHGSKSSFEVSSKEVVRPSKETCCGNFLVAVSFPVLVLFFAGVVVGCIVFKEELSSELTTVMPPIFFSGLSLSSSELLLREQAESVRELVWLREGASEPYQLTETSIITRLTMEDGKGEKDEEALQDLLAPMTTASGRPTSLVKQGSTTGSFLLEMTWTLNDLSPSSPEDFHSAVLAFKRKVVHSDIQAVSEQLEEAGWALHSFRNPTTRTHEHPLWQWSAIAGVYLLFQLWNMRTVLVPVFNTLLLALILFVVQVIAHRFMGETGIALGTLAFAKFLALISMFQVSSVADAWRVAVWSTNPRQGRILNQKAAVTLSTSVWAQFISSCSLCISIAALTAIFQTFELGMILVAALLAQSVTFICILLCQIPFLILYDNSVQPANSASRSDPFAVKPEISEPKQERIWVSPEEEPKMNPPMKVEQPSIWRSLNRAQGKWVFTLDFKLGPMITSWQGPLFAVFFCIKIFLIFTLVREGADTAVPLQFWTANGSDDSSTSFKERRKLFLVQGLDLEMNKSYLEEADFFITMLEEDQALPDYDLWFSKKLSTDLCEVVNSVAGIQLVQPYGCWPEAVLNGSQQAEYYERLGFTASRNSKASNEDTEVFYTILEAEASGEQDITELADELRNLDGDSTQVLVGDQLEIKEDHLPLSVWIISAAVAPVLILLGSANPLLALITALLTASSFACISSLLFSITKWVALSRGYLRPLATAAGASSYFTSAASLDFHHRSGSSISEIVPSTFLSQTLTLLLVTVAYSVAASLIDNELWFIEEIGLSIGIACVQALLFATPLLSMLKPIHHFSDLKNHFKPKATSPASRPPHAVPPSVKSEAISLNQPLSFGIAGEDREMILANAEHQNLQGQAMNQPMHGQDLELGEIDADKTI